MDHDYDLSIFVNCPFDDEYAALFDAITFAVHDCGFVARSALEDVDSSQIRMDKLFDVIGACRHGIHDISRTELDSTNGLPRFNMPLELGIFLGARRFGDRSQRNKGSLIMDREPYRYQIFCSGIAGQDIKSHGGKIQLAIRIVRDWLRGSASAGKPSLPSGKLIFERYIEFMHDLPVLCLALDLYEHELTFSDYTKLITSWLIREGSRTFQSRPT